MTEQAVNTVPVMITILTAANTILVAAVAFFLKRFLNKFDSVVTNVELHNVTLSTSQTRCDERSARVNGAILDIQNEQDKHDNLLQKHSLMLAEHTKDIETIKKTIE